MLSRMWQRVASWVADNAEHVTVRFLPDETGSPVQPHAGYLRLWLAEGFLAGSGPGARTSSRCCTAGRR